MAAASPDPSQYETIKQLILSGQREQARQILTRLVKEYPNDPHAWYGLSQVMDDPERVKFCLQRALALMPESQVMRDQLARFEVGVEARQPPAQSTTLDVPAASRSGALPEAQPASSVSPVPAVSLHVGSLDDFATDAHISSGLERKRNRMKLRFLLGLPALVVVCCLLGLAIAWQGVNNGLVGGGLPSGHTVVYRAEGTARSNRINYLTSSGASITLDPQDLPWTKTYQFRMLETIPPTLIVDSHEPSTTVTCIITVDGVEVARRSSHGDSPQIVCRYELPQLP